LGVEDRIRPLQATRDTIAREQPHPDLSEAEKRALDRRIADPDGNPANDLSREEIAAKIMYCRIQSDRLEVIAVCHRRRHPAGWQFRV
jgi:putative addiction module component (TIGR02574 family)